MNKNRFLAGGIIVLVIAFTLSVLSSVNIAATYLFATLFLGNLVSYISTQVHRLPRGFDIKQIKPFDWKYFYRFSVISYLAFTIVVIISAL